MTTAAVPATAGWTGKAKKVEPIDQGGRTLYRSSITGFASKASAQAFCTTLKAQGRACMVHG